MRPTNLRYLAKQEQFADGSLTPSTGGDLIQMQALGNLNVGDVVQLAGTCSVNKAITNGFRTIGVVVGGDSMPDKGIFETTGSQASDAALITAGILAAVNGQKVYIVTQGVVYVVADGAIANGSSICPSLATAGRVTSGSNALTVAAGGTAVTSTAANGAIISGSGAANPSIGVLIDVAAALNGDVRLAYINI